MKEGAERLARLVERWFYSDLDIEFVLKKGRERLYCKFESDVYYYKGKRRRGKRRRFLAIHGSDKIYNEIKHLASTGKYYTKEELMNVIKELDESFEVEA